MHTSSLAFPKMFNIATNQVATLNDAQSVVNRSKLLFLTSPTEIYNELDQGVGLRKYIWQYNNENTKAMIKDNIVDQLDKYEPYCVAEETQFADGLKFTGTEVDMYPEQEYNRLKMTVSIKLTFEDEVSINLEDL